MRVINLYFLGGGDFAIEFCMWIFSVDYLMGYSMIMDFGSGKVVKCIIKLEIS